MRHYHDSEMFSKDYYKVREFLLRLGDRNYPFGRWDWMISNGYMNRDDLKRIGLWEENGEIVAAVIYDTKPNKAFLLILPEHEGLYAEMIEYAAREVADEHGSSLMIPDNDRNFQDLAARQGFRPSTNKEADAIFHIETTPTDYTLPDGFYITSMKDSYDIDRYAKVLWQGFNHEEKEGPFRMKAEDRPLWEVTMKRPHVDLSLKIAVIAPDGDFAAYCGMWYDTASEFALVEPVATVPKYRKMGLGKAAVLEGIRRCGVLGAKYAVVGSSQQFYYSIGFRPLQTATEWTRPIHKEIVESYIMPEHLKIVEYDPYLSAHEPDLKKRISRFYGAKKRLTTESLYSFANGHLFFGFHRTDTGWVYREWAPNAREITLFGDFNGWDRSSHPLTRIENDVWEIHLSGHDALVHGSKVRIEITTRQGEILERIPSFCKRVVQNMENFSFDGQIWNPDIAYQWKISDFKRNASEPPLIYECHIGMSGEKEGITTYSEFVRDTLPRVHALGYNTIQIMAIMEHPYYGSFGYQVSNFFAASSRFGTPEELKALIDAAHSMGITVLLDLVHSHAARNEAEGLARFDGTVYQYFHEGKKGIHPQWNSMLFNYAKPEVLHFLLSNLKFWLEEYRFDGFRFDGVTSMLYHDHGLGGVFDHYGKYFSANTDHDAVTYLQLATALCKETNPDCLLIAEDMSGMPGMCLSIEEGGIGFDYRLGMGVPDLWIKLLKTKQDEQWEMGQIWHELTSRRAHEKVIGYCESHDQALVGDKTIMFRLADKEMYWHMDNNSQSLIVDRAVALHKMIRLVTCVNAGEGYLNFMGNEFGHPEWIDFPRPGNGNSYARARRLWSLADNGLLRYGFLRAFDIAMVSLAKELLTIPSRQVWFDEAGKFLAFEKGGYIFLLNFHPREDFSAAIHAENLTGGTSSGAAWRLVLHSNWREFGGYADHINEEAECRDGFFRARIDRRCALVFKRER